MESNFRSIFEDNYSHLCRVAFRILREEEMAREVVQEVFVELWKRGNWEQIQSLKGYLYIAVYNRSLNELKKRKRFVSESAVPERSAADHQQMEYHELERSIAQGIDDLPDQCKKIFLLSREEEMTYAQIAKHMDLSIKTIERQMGIALQRLREHLKIYLSE